MIQGYPKIYLLLLKAKLLASDLLSTEKFYFNISSENNHMINMCTSHARASTVAQLVKNSPAMRETWVQSLGWEDPLETGKATHSSILAWKIPRTV